MHYRAYETKHKNGVRLLHVVEESVDSKQIAELATHQARSPLEEDVLQRDVTGSYLLASGGHESMGFTEFVSPRDSLADLDAYQQKVQNQASYPGTCDRLWFSGICLSGAAAEFAEKALELCLNASSVNGDLGKTTPVSDVDESRLCEKLEDTLLSVTTLASAMGLSLSNIALESLKRRSGSKK